MNKKHVIAIVGIIAMISFFVISASAIMASKNTIEKTPIEQNVQSTESGKVTVKMSMTGNIYKFSPASVNVGDEVTIVADMNTISGCFKNFVMPGYSIRKYLSQNDNKITFIANKAGSFPVTCAMGMGTGKLIVK